MRPSRSSGKRGKGPSPEGSDNDDVASGDLRRMTSGDPSPRTRQSDTRKEACTPALAATAEGSAVQSDGDGVVSGGGGTMSGEKSSNASSRGGSITRSGRVLNSDFSGRPPITKKRRRNGLCGLDICGSTSGWGITHGAACVDCGAVHTGNDLLCAACHRIGYGINKWRHLGPTMYAEAMAWFEQCRAAGEGLPTRVVESFVPSTSCICSRGDCFFQSFSKYRLKVPENTCVPCGSTKSVQWRYGGARTAQYQLYFEGAGRNRTDHGMLKTKEVITAESAICNPCHMAFHDYVTAPGRHPTAKELLSAPAGPQLPQGTARAKHSVKRHVYEALVAGKVVCCEDIEAWLVTERRANDIDDASAGRVRKIALEMMRDIGECIGDASLREYRGGTIGEDSRQVLVYLIPTSGREDIIVRFDRQVRKKDRENEDLRQHLREARGERSSGDAFARVI